jgi:N-acetylneuraminate synthase
MGKKLELSFDTFASLQAKCHERGIMFLASPFDDESLRFLLEVARVPLIKIASGEVTNAPLLLQAARGGLPIILSTGMSEPDEVEGALSVVAFGYTRPGEEPSLPAFHESFESETGRASLRANVTLLHCTTEYPAPVEDANLGAMDALRARFSLAVGLSDHTQGIVVPMAAVARGATVIEKHFTLDRNLPGPDHTASLEPAELASMIRGIRMVEAALGSGAKKPAPSELKNRPVARRSLVAARPIKKGEFFSVANLAAKRPGIGISPMRYWDFLGRAAERDYDTDDLIQPPNAPCDS